MDKVHYDWKSNINMNIFMLKLMGLWPKEDEIYKQGLYVVYRVLMVTLFIACHFSSQVINIYFVRDNLESVVGIIYILLIEFMAVCKVFYVIKKMKILKGQITVLKSDWFQPKNGSQKDFIEPSIKFWRYTYKMLLVTCFACNTFWMIYPLLDASTEERRLPFLAWYPYDYKISPLYELTYLFQAVSTSYMILVHVSVDNMISGFNVYTGCQFDILSDNLRNLSSMSSDVKKSLIMCVVHHKKILSFVEGCGQFFNGVLFWHLIVSGVSIGITMFQLTLVVPFSNEFYSLLSYGFAIVIEIFMYCWFGNEVEVRSNLVSYAAFESDWRELPEDVKKNLLFFTMNVIKPVQISVFNVFYLSVDTFMKILKTAWSYFALLYQLSSRNG